MTKVYDLSKEGHGFVPLPVSTMHRASLRAAVLGVLREIPGASHEALAQYSKERTIWEIPPLYAGEFSKVSLQLSVDVSKSRSPKAYPEYLEVLEQFRKYGWEGRTEAMLAARLGDLGSHRDVFDRRSTDVRKFAVEYALTISRRFRRGFYLEGDSIAVKVPHGDGWAWIGLLKGKLPQYPDMPALDASSIFDMILPSRGTVIARRYGVYDRLLRWAELNYQVLKEADGLRFALSLLKLSCKDEEEWAFEDEVRYSREVEYVDAGPNPFSDEALDIVRSAWFDTVEGGDAGALQALFTAASPTYIDSRAFKRMFGILPEQDQELTSKQVERIDRGISKFALHFMTAARKHEDARKNIRRK